MTTIDEEISELPEQVRFAFSPLVKRAMGVGVGATFALILLAMNSWHLLVDPDPEHMQHLFLLRYNFFRGYDPESWGGMLVGALWALWTGFVLGWFLAAMRNFFVAIWIITIRARANLSANRDFLDHI